MRTDRTVTMMTSDRVAIWPIVDRQTTVKTLPSFARLVKKEEHQTKTPEVPSSVLTEG